MVTGMARLTEYPMPGPDDAIFGTVTAGSARVAKPPEPSAGDTGKDARGPGESGILAGADENEGSPVLRSLRGLRCVQP